MEYKKMSKDKFLDAVYELTCDAMDNFQKYANQNLYGEDSLIFVSAAIENGNLFISNQTCMALAELTDEKVTTYFQDDRGAFGFCPSNQYDYVKEYSLDDEDVEKKSNKEFHTDENEDTKRIYG